MRPDFDRLFAAHGLPLWLVPDYFVLVAIGSVLGAAIHHRLARRDGADAARETRALAVAYLCALLGGYVFEWIRAIPAAIVAHSVQPILMQGRAAYGGLLGGMLGAALYLRRARLPLAGFFDRVSVGTGIVFAFVRTGCFLEGCDYGRVTSSSLGVRFPAGSLAALDHASRGWVPAGAVSLPVHPTELYEASVGAIGAIVAGFVLRRGRRNGEAFAAWLAVYAIGRFATECLRGDVERGVYLAMSSAQWVSVTIVCVVGAWLVRLEMQRSGSWRSRDPFVLSKPQRGTSVAVSKDGGHATGAAALALLTALLLAPSHAHAQGHSHTVSTSASASASASPASSSSGGTGFILPNGSTRANASAAAATTTAAPPTIPPFYVQLSSIVSFPLTQIQPGYIAIQPPQGVAPPPLPPGYVLAVPIPPPGYPALQPGPGIVLVQPIYTATAAQQPAMQAPPVAAAAPPVEGEDIDANAALGTRTTNVAPPESPQLGARVTTRLTYFGSFNFSRGSVPWGQGAELAGAYRVHVGRHVRFEAGLEGGFQRTGIATQWTLGIFLGLHGHVGSVFEIGMTLVPQHTWIVFDSPFYAGTNAFGGRIQFDMQFAVGSHVLLGLSPLGLGFMNSESIGTVVSYSPRLWGGVVF